MKYIILKNNQEIGEYIINKKIYFKPKIKNNKYVNYLQNYINEIVELYSIKKCHIIESDFVNEPEIFIHKLFLLKKEGYTIKQKYNEVN